jgi:NTP pyrophosphatase (non-canonical NTP hydrolase)
MNHDTVIELIFMELRKAEEKHPFWPDDVIHAVGIITEEVGEAMQEAIDWTYTEKKNMENLKKELAQTGAMAIRALMHLPDGDGL